MLACPACATPIEQGSHVCSGCGLFVRIEGGRATPVYPDVRPGAVLASHDLVRTRPPGMNRGTRTLENGVRVSEVAEGLALELPGGQAFRSGISLVRRRDVCVRANFVASDPSVRFSLVARCELMGKATTHYSLIFDMGKLLVRLERVIASPKITIATPLTEWRPAAGLLPVGQPNDVELRAFGATLEGLVSGRRVLVFHDPVLGVGYPGIRVEAIGAAGRCLWRGLEIREVAS
ncbi:MAG TPA: hypothetical protein VIF62_01885 [Labilithrix sp.]